MKFWAAIFAIAALAAGLRFADLPRRPMHADEAVLADKFGTLLETGRYAYDPSDYHGPLLLYATLIPARAAGVSTYRALTETVLRSVPAASGVLLVLAPLLLMPAISWPAALCAALFTAVSPAMVFYSRYYIPETLLVTATAAAIGCAYQYTRLRRPSSLLNRDREGAVWAAGAALSLVLMFAAKETAVIAAVSGLAAYAVATRPRWIYLAGAAALLATLAAWPAYVARAFHPGAHGHFWHFYGGLLALSGEMILLALAPFALARGAGMVRFLAVYAVLMTVVYSALPYKTPWCLLGFWHAWILLAGAGAASLLTKTRWSAIPVAACCAVFTWQSWRLSFTLPSDPRNPYVYAHTLPDVIALRDQVERLSPAHVQVIAKRNVWPLPWYLRDLPAVEWWTDARPDMRPAPVVIAEPEFESALAERVYATAPPGERELYVPLFDQPIALRPGVPLQAWARKSLYDRAAGR